MAIVVGQSLPALERIQMLFISGHQVRQNSKFVSIQGG
jgi:hypothetical protein